MHVMHFFCDCLPACRIETAAARHIKKVASRAVASEDEVNDAALSLLGRLQKNGACAVAKQNAGCAVLKINDRGHYIGADDKNLAVGACTNELCARCQRINEAGTRSGEVESPCSLCADLGLNQTRRCREEHVWRDGSDDNKIDFRSIHAALFQQSLRRGRPQIAGCLAFTYDTPLAYPCSCDNPLIGSIDGFFQVLICESLLRQIMADCGYFGTTQIQ